MTITQQLEEWRPVRRQPGYEVSSLGRVRSVDRIVRTSHGVDRRYKGKLLRPGVSNRDGHMTVVLGAGNTVGVHILVAEAFLGPAPFPEAEVRHIDGKPGHNVWTNLAWGTRSQNLADAKWHAPRYLSGEQGQEVYARVHAGERQIDLAAEFGVTQSAVSCIKLQKSHRA